MLFQQHLQLQMWLVSRIIWYAGWFYIGSLVFFALLRVFTGVSIKRLGYFSLRHLSIHPKQGIEIRIGKLGIVPHRPTVARPGFVTFLVSNLEVIIDSELIIDHEEELSSQKDAEGGEKSSEDIAMDAYKAAYEAFSGHSFKGVPLLPKSKTKLLGLIRWIVTHIGVFDVQISSVSLVFSSLVTMVITVASLRVDLRKTLNYKRSNFVGTLDSYKLADNELPLSIKLGIIDFYTAESLEDESPWQLVDDLRFDISSVLNVDEMTLKEASVHVHTSRLLLDVTWIQDLMNKIVNMRARCRSPESKETEPSNQKSPPAKGSLLGSRDKERMMVAANLLLHLISHVQFTVGMLESSRIPVALRNHKIPSLGTEIKDSDPERVMMAIGMKDLNVDVSRMNSKASGFRLLYDEDDLAHQLIFMLASLNISFDNDHTQEEILYVPMVTGLNRGNIFSQTLKYLRSSDPSKVNGAHVRSRWATYAPTASIEEHQLPSFVRVLMGFVSSRKDNDKQDGDFNFDGLQASAEDSTGRAIQHLLPNFDLEIVVSDGTSRTRCKDTKEYENAIFITSAESVVISLAGSHCVAAPSLNSHNNSKGEEKDSTGFQAKAVFATKGAKAWYHSSNLSRFDITAIEDTLICVKASTVPTLNVEIKGYQENIHVNILRHEIFSAMGHLHSAMWRPIEQWYERHPGERAIHDNNAPVHKGSKLRDILPFLTKFELDFKNFSTAMASNHFRGKENDVLGMKFVTNSLSMLYMSQDPHMPESFTRKSNTDGRHFSLTGNDFVLYKADRDLLESMSPENFDKDVLKQRIVADLPALAMHVWTHNSNETEVNICIRPRLKILLNINLILAYSVLRENLNEMFLHFNGRNKQPEKQQSPKATSDRSPMEPSQVSVEQHRIKLRLPRALVKIDLPSDDQIMIELDDANLHYFQGENPILNTKALRMYSRHPMKHEAWCILLSLVSFKLEYNLAKREIQDKILLNVDGFRINVPYKFKLYRIIDNGITLAKAIKTLILQTDTLDTMIVLDPKRIDGIIDLPRTRLTAGELFLSLEDDYFESDLTLCMLTQLEVAESRRQKLFRFDTHLKRMLVLGIKVLDEVRILQNKRGNEDSDGENDKLNHISGMFDFTGVSSRFMRLDDGVSDKISKAAKTFKRGANTVLDHTARLYSDRNRASARSLRPSESSRNSSPSGRIPSLQERETPIESETGEDYLHRLAQALIDVPSDLIEKLLREGLELGDPADDNDPAFTQGHVWLDFWSNPQFERLRSTKMILDDGTPGSLNVGEARDALLADFSRMWVDTIRHARMTQHYGVKCRMEEVVKDELNQDTCNEETIVAYSQKPLILAMSMRRVDLTVQTTTHNTPEKLHKFLYDIGKGQPMDSEFSILVPFYMDLKVKDGLKVDIKDYPLPILHFPGLARDQDPNKNLALRVVGDLVITEQLMNVKQNLRRLFVPLKVLPRQLRKTRGSDVIEVHRTLTPIKTFTDLDFHVGTTLPSRVSWCMAYKPGFHSVGEAFSGLTKPPIDLSPALGFWDKIRLVLHARFDFKFPHSSICLAIKAGKSPYTLLNRDSGFIFFWRDNVHFHINPNDDPKNLFSIESDRFQLLVPNYISWESEFLNQTAAERAFPRRNPIASMDDPDKVVFSFNQRTIWQLGMKFEKGVKTPFMDPATGKKSLVEIRDANFRPHYDIRMSLPEYIQNVEDYDAYLGFRSDFIYMSISVRSQDLGDPETCLNSFDSTNQVNKNAAHLTMGVIQHFKAWKDQFNGEQWPPIKTGSLFPDPVRVRPSTRTFGTALSTSSYQIVLNTLDLSFFQHLSNHRGNVRHYRSTGLKAKIDRFEFDWHTRREPPKLRTDSDEDTHVELSGQRRWRMHSYKSQIRFKMVHLRAIEAKLRTLSTNQALHELRDFDSEESDDEMEDDVSVSDSDSQSGTTSMASSPQNHSFPFHTMNQHYGPRYLSADNWVDWNDFTEVGLKRKLRNAAPDVRVLPFIYTPEFVFTRNTDFTDKAIYVDGTTGDRFPKFGAVDVQTYHIAVEPSGSVQAALLGTRQEQLKERMADLQASYDSLESSTIPKSQQQQKYMMAILSLLAIGKHNQTVIQNEIDSYLQASTRDDQRLADMRRRIAKDLKDTLDCLDIPNEMEAELGEKAEFVKRFIRDVPDTSDVDSATFRNRYVIHAMHLKWDNSVRDLIYRLLYAFEEEKELNYVRCRPAVEYLEELVKKAEKMAHDHRHGTKSANHTTSSEDNDHDHHHNDHHHSEEPHHDHDHNIFNPFAHSKQGHSEEHRVHPKGHKFFHPQMDEESIDRETTNTSASSFTDLNKLTTRDSHMEKNHAHYLPDHPHGSQVQSEMRNDFNQTCDSRLQRLFKDLKRVPSTEVSHNAHFLYLPTPRIQLVSEKNPSKCFQVIARSVELQVVDTYPQNKSYDDESAKIERRIGSVLNDASFFVLGERDLEQPGVETLLLEPYSGDEVPNDRPWPPWLVVELCYNPEPMKEFQVVKDVSFGITFHKPNDLHVAENDENSVASQDKDKDSVAIATLENRDSGDSGDLGLRETGIKDETPTPFVPTKSHNDDNNDWHEQGETVVPRDLRRTLQKHGDHKGKAILTSIVIDAPKVLVDVDSVQFYTLYTILTDLISYQDPLIKKREEAINRVVLLNDFSGDHISSLGTIELLQKDIRQLLFLRQRLQISVSLTRETTDNVSQLHLIKMDREITRRQTRLIVLIRAFKASLRRNMNTGVDKFTKISILADGVDVCVLNEVGKPMLDLVLRRAHFSRLSSDDERSVNRATLAGISARNLLEDSVYRQMLANYEVPNSNSSGEPEDAIKLLWTRLQRVGGIPVLDNIDVRVKPMHIQVEQGMFDKLLDFAFPITGNVSKSDDKGSSDRKSTNETREEDDTANDDTTDDDSDSEISVTLSELEEEGDEEKVREKKRQRRSQHGEKKKKRFGLFKRLVHPSAEQDGQELGVDELVNRASSYWSIRRLNIRPTDLVISYKGKQRSLLNIQNLHLQFPGYEVSNKTWTKLDLVMRIKKIAIKALLVQSGSIMGNMLKRHKSHASEDKFDVTLPSLSKRFNRSNPRIGIIDPKDMPESLTRGRENYEDADERLLEEVTRVLLIPYHRQMAIDNPHNLREVTRAATAHPGEFSQLSRSQSILSSEASSVRQSGNGPNNRLSSDRVRRSGSLHRNGSSRSGSNGYQEYTNNLRHPPLPGSSRGSLRQQSSRPSSLQPSRSPRVVSQESQRTLRATRSPQLDSPRLRSPKSPSEDEHSPQPGQAKDESPKEDLKQTSPKREAPKPLVRLSSVQSIFKRKDSDTHSVSSTSSQKSSNLLNKIRHGFS